MPRRSRASPARPLPRDLGRNRGGLGARVPAVQAQLRRPARVQRPRGPGLRRTHARTGVRRSIPRIHALRPAERAPARVRSGRRDAGSDRGRRLSTRAAAMGRRPRQGWRVPGFRGTVGFITAVSHHFCGSCDRLRLTADGFFVNCLYGEKRCDLKPLLRGRDRRGDRGRHPGRAGSEMGGPSGSHRRRYSRVGNDVPDRRLGVENAPAAEPG